MKLVWPAPERNKAPILEVLRSLLPSEGRLLEIASGTGQHVAHFARHLPRWRLQPTELADASRASIVAHIAEENLANVEPPIALDVREASWPVGEFDAVFCANMIHIAPWGCTLGLVRGAAEHLASDGLLMIYGPFRFSGSFTSESNAAFDQDLQLRDPRWGVRDVDDVDACAREHGFARTDCIAMPANNHVLVYRRSQAPSA